MAIHRDDGTVELSGDPLVIEILRQHAWNAKAKGCACGWHQRDLGRGREQHNHPHHVASMIATAQAGATR